MASLTIPIASSLVLPQVLTERAGTLATNSSSSSSYSSTTLYLTVGITPPKAETPLLPFTIAQPWASYASTAFLDTTSRYQRPLFLTMRRCVA